MISFLSFLVFFISYIVGLLFLCFCRLFFLFLSLRFLYDGLVARLILDLSIVLSMYINIFGFYFRVCTFSDVVFVVESIAPPSWPIIYPPSCLSEPIGLYPHPFC